MAASARMAGSSRFVVPWRALEWAGVCAALSLQTGAFFPVFAAGPDGALDEADRAGLRLLFAPVLAVALALAARHPGAVATVLRRNAPLVALAALAAASVLWSVSPSVTARRALALGGSLMLAAVIAARFTPRQTLTLAAVALGPPLVASLAAAVVAPGLALMPGEPALRGVFTHKNALGWAAAVGAAAAAFLALAAGPRRRLPALLLLAVAAACLVLSRSATGLVIALTPLLVAPALRTLARRRGVARLATASVLVCLAAAFLALLTAFVEPALAALGRDATLTGRVPLWRLVDEAVARRPFLGYGYQAFWTPANGEAWRIWAAIRWDAPHAHNGYRETLLGLGLIGASMAALVLGRAIWQGAALYCRTRDSGWLWLNAFIAMFLVVNLTESVILAQNDYLWTLAAVAIMAFGARHAR